MPRLPLSLCGIVSLLFGLAAPPLAAQSCLCGTAADEFVAARAGLSREWVVQVPFDSAAWRLEHVVVGDGLVVAQGGDGIVAAISTAARPGRPRPGTVIWARRIGGEPAPLEPAGIGSDAVTIARGLQLTALDARTGRLLWERPLRTAASATAVPSGGWIYAPLDAGGIARFPVKPAAPELRIVDAPKGEGEPSPRLGPLTISSDGEVDLTPLPFEGGLLWCTSDGLIIALLASGREWERLDEFRLGSPATGPPVEHEGNIFVATRARNLVRLATSPNGLAAYTGSSKNSAGDTAVFRGWQTITNGIPDGSPLVSSNAVVLSLGPSGIAAFSTVTGEPLWTIPSVGRPLAIAGDNLWCLEETGFLVARDLTNGDSRRRLRVGCFTLPVINPRGDRIVLASPGGLVVSLAPRQTVPAEPPVPQPPADAEPAADPEPAADAA